MNTICDEPRLLLNESEAAHLLNVCGRTLARMRNQGKLKFLKIGNAVRYSRADIEEFIESQAKTT
ncbi:Helix-turn-helix domain protein [Gimesia maris]|uniref:helix-turn-helix domain-containing protein n=1 Tax=Gimesia maris TaxID=122 RepID=UPI0011883ABF|nr:helix-turn-helix domain-containing protein [Gimesia maris]QDU13596.1 Helix-turn-helix domain protein [Gimesia maris]